MSVRANRDGPVLFSANFREEIDNDMTMREKTRVQEDHIHIKNPENLVKMANTGYQEHRNISE